MLKRAEYFKDEYRPQFHYSAETHIINDPNGLFYYEGEYHLMHQYNINNHIHWGHAVSRDLVHWKHLPPALAPDSIGQIWSGSAVVDRYNTSGLQCGKEKVISALFTYNEHTDAQQSQGLAYSNDRGRTWKKYEQNPVLTSGGKRDFRDPKVFWFEEGDTWIAVLACGNHVEFYKSANLMEWDYAGEFGAEDGAHRGVWECPDLFQLPVRGRQNESRWILLVSVNDGAPAGGTGMQYFVGTFDGSRFVNDSPAEKELWLDYGKDFYAGVTWNDIPEEDNRRLMIGWSDNWLYRDDLPTSLFKGQFSSVRELQLVKNQDGIRIVQRPVREMQGLAGAQYEIEPCVLIPGKRLELPVREETFELRIELELQQPDSVFELKLENGKDNYVKLIYDNAESCLSFDRSHCGQFDIRHFNGVFQAPLKIKDNFLKLHLLVDVSQVELFADDGAVVMTNLFFSGNPGVSVSIAADRRPLKLIRAACRTMESVWAEKKSKFSILDTIISGKWAETVQGFEGCSETEGLITNSGYYDDFCFTVKVKIMSYQKGGAAGLVFGVDQSQKDYRIILDALRNEVSLLSGNDVVDTVAFIINRERQYQVQLEMKEQNLCVWLDGVCLMIKQLKTYTGGRLGLFIDDTNALFHDLSI